jgi:hypothetical protein
MAQNWTKEELTAGLQKIEYSRFIPSGVKRQLDFAYAVNLDCVPTGSIEFRKVHEPEHGTVEFSTAEGFSSYKEDSKYAKCNDKKVLGGYVYYKSEDGYVGPDSFAIIAMYPTGLAREVRYKLVVR